MSKTINLTERILQGSTIVIFFTALTSILSYGLRILYSHLLTIEEYGLFYAVINLSGAIILYSDLGFTYSASFLIPKYILRKDYLKSWNAYKYSQLVGVGATSIIAIMLTILAPWLSSQYFKTAQAQNLIYIFCIYLIANSFVNTQHALFVGLQQEKYYSSIQAVRIFLTVLLTLLFWVFWGRDLNVFAFIATASYLLCGLIFTFLIYKKNAFLQNLKLRWDSNLFKQMYTYAIPTLLASSVYSLIIFSDTFFLTLFRGIEEVGVYNIALPLASIPLIILSPFANFLFPLISHLSEKNRGKITLIMDSILRIIPFAALYFALFISMFPSQPILLLFGEKWSGPTEFPLSILSLGYIPATISFFFTTVVMGLGNTKQRLKALTVVALVSFGLNAPFVYYFGIAGAAVAACIIHLTSVLFLGRIIKSNIAFNYPYKLYLKLILFSISLYVLVKLTHFEPQSLPLYLLTGLTYTLIVTLFGLSLKLMNYVSIKQIFTKRNE